MSKKLICLFVVLGLATSALADGGDFTDLMGDQDWNNNMNWSTMAVPASTDTANITIGLGSTKTANIGVGVAAGTRGGNVGNRTGAGTTLDPYVNGNGTLNIQGSLDVGLFVTIGREAGDVGVVNVDGGTFSLVRNIVVGRHGTGTLNVTNGATVDNSIAVGAYNGTLAVPARDGVGRMYVSGGSSVTTYQLQVPGWWVSGGGYMGDGEVHISGNSTITTESLIWGDLLELQVPTDGDFIKIYDTSKLILIGNKQALALDAIGDGLIIGDGGATVYVDYVGGNTIVDIPEPMTIALLGLGGLFLRRRK